MPRQAGERHALRRGRRVHLENVRAGPELDRPVAGRALQARIVVLIRPRRLHAVDVVDLRRREGAEGQGCRERVEQVLPGAFLVPPGQAVEAADAVATARAHAFERDEAVSLDAVDRQERALETGLLPGYGQIERSPMLQRLQKDVAVGHPAFQQFGRPETDLTDVVPHVRAEAAGDDPGGVERGRLMLQRLGCKFDQRFSAFVVAFDHSGRRSK